jgi:hypothetical protein
MTSETTEHSEDELRAAWDEQLRKLTPADLIVQTVVSLINLAGRRLGLEPGTQDERDLEQARDGIDGARALLPVLERRERPEALAPLRDALSSLQLHYARLAAAGSGGSAAPGGGSEPAPEPEQRGGPREPEPEQREGSREPGPAQRSGRLWVPGS